MKICVCGTQCVGKSTFINDFLQKWPMYKKPGKSYRDYIEERNIKINQEGDLEGQKAIQEILIQQLEDTKDNEFVIYDRGPLDNLVYSIWHNAKGLGGVDDLFIERSLLKTKAAIEMYDIIFFIPLSEKYDIPIVADKQRDIDPQYRKEIDYLFKAIMETYHLPENNTFFPKEQCPAVIEIFGTPQERVTIASFYVNSDGKAFGDSDSLLNNMSEEDQEIVKDFTNQFKIHHK